MLTITDTPNVARTLNRSAKARALADVYAAKLDGSPTQAACLDFDSRDALAVEAGVNTPSEATWDAVVAILEDRAANTPRLASVLPCGHRAGECGGHPYAEWQTGLVAAHGDGAGL